VKLAGGVTAPEQPNGLTTGNGSQTT
jgi:hypothetical protein